MNEFDVIWIHHWLHPFTFPPFDIALRALGVPVIYDFDIAGMVTGRPSDRAGTFIRALALVAFIGAVALNIAAH